MESLLPKNSTKLERAYEQALLEIVETEISIDKLMSYKDCPVKFLPWLAWHMSVDVWNDDWDEHTKREVIRVSNKVHKVKGTRGAMDIAVKSLGCKAKVFEWWEDTPKKKPYTFRVEIEAQGIGLPKEKYDSVFAILYAAKNLRSQISSIYVQSETEFDVSVSAHTDTVENLVIEPFFKKEIPLNSEINVGAIVSSAESINVSPHFKKELQSVFAPILGVGVMSSEEIDVQPYFKRQVPVSLGLKYGAGLVCAENICVEPIFKKEIPAAFIFSYGVESRYAESILIDRISNTQSPDIVFKNCNKNAVIDVPELAVSSSNAEKAYFEITKSPYPSVGVVVDCEISASRSWFVPKGKLLPKRAYFVHASVFRNGEWSKFSTVKFDTQKFFVKLLGLKCSSFISGKGNVDPKDFVVKLTGVNVTGGFDFIPVGYSLKAFIDGSCVHEESSNDSYKDSYSIKNIPWDKDVSVSLCVRDMRYGWTSAVEKTFHSAANISEVRAPNIQFKNCNKSSVHETPSFTIDESSAEKTKFVITESADIGSGVVATKELSGCGTWDVPADTILPNKTYYLHASFFKSGGWSRVKTEQFRTKEIFLYLEKLECTTYVTTDKQAHHANLKFKPVINIKGDTKVQGLYFNIYGFMDNTCIYAKTGNSPYEENPRVNNSNWGKTVSVKLRIFDPRWGWTNWVEMTVKTANDILRETHLNSPSHNSTVNKGTVVYRWSRNLSSIRGNTYEQIGFQAITYVNGKKHAMNWKSLNNQDYLYCFGLPPNANVELHMRHQTKECGWSAFHVTKFRTNS